MLTGIHCTDYSDASGMLLLDVEHKCWSREMMDICGVKEEQLPQLFESYEVVGLLKKEIADRLGLTEAVRVVAGAGDNAAAAVGTGTSERENAIFHLELPELFSFPVKNSEWMNTMHCIPLLMQMELPSDGMYAQRCFLQ